MGEDPLSGEVFLFCNKLRNILRAIWWDKTGFWTAQKKLEKHRWPWPENKEAVNEINSRQMATLEEALKMLEAANSIIQSQQKEISDQQLKIDAQASVIVSKDSQLKKKDLEIKAKQKEICSWPQKLAVCRFRRWGPFKLSLVQPDRMC